MYMAFNGPKFSAITQQGLSTHIMNTYKYGLP